MTKNIILLAAAALFLAIALADLVGGTSISRYILLLGSVGLGAFAIRNIQKNEPK